MPTKATPKVFPASLNLKKQRAVAIENELYSKDRRKWQPPSKNEYKKAAGSIGREYHSDCGAIEYTTKPLRLSYIRSKRGQRQLLSYYEGLSGIAKVSNHNGTHVHISLMDHDHPDIEARAIVIATQFYTQLQKIAGRNSLQWARSPGKETVESAKKCLRGMKFRKTNEYETPSRQSYGRQYWILTPTSRQTLEFRGPKGTVDPMEILAWTDLLENIVRVCNRKRLRTLHIREILKGKYLEPYVEKLVQEETLTQEDLAAKITKGLE